ncbi:DNA cytosine methyltransferase [Panacagrimonas sp.]|uniref:DNA cytosine methyltransferase n=1 Tax=Panacagrimonas sp. TaxID=2480088 RepID=UPI003B51F566
MNELALFAGVGGGILGGHLLGWRTVCAVETDDYAASVLLARQNDGVLPPFPVWDDVRTFDGRPWRGRVDVVSGGFPCQDISVAGKGAGLSGERSGLWSEMARIVGEVRPRYVFVENSPALVSRGLGRVLGGLAALGFDAAWRVLSAGDCGAWHERERIWIVAHASGRRHELADEAICAGRNAAEPGGEAIADPDGLRQLQPQGREQEQRGRPAHDAGDAMRSGLQASRSKRLRPDWQQGGRSIAAANRWPAEPNVVRMVHGSPARVDRIRGLGNIQVPRVAAAAFAELSRAVE